MPPCMYRRPHPPRPLLADPPTVGPGLPRQVTNRSHRPTLRARTPRVSNGNRWLVDVKAWTTGRRHGWICPRMRAKIPVVGWIAGRLFAWDVRGRKRG